MCQLLLCLMTFRFSIPHLGLEAFLTWKLMERDCCDRCKCHWLNLPLSLSISIMPNKVRIGEAIIVGIEIYSQLDLDGASLYTLSSWLYGSAVFLFHAPLSFSKYIYYINFSLKRERIKKVEGGGMKNMIAWWERSCHVRESGCKCVGKVSFVWGREK